MKQKQPQPKQPQAQEQKQVQGKPSQERILRTAITNRWKLRFKLFEGEELTGIPQVYDPYSITLLTEDNRLILLYKHTIKYFEPLLP
ncbi:MAG: RNA chaperone Hfq [Aquificaceae bacterium]